VMFSSLLAALMILSNTLEAFYSRIKLIIRIEAIQETV